MAIFNSYVSLPEGTINQIAVDISVGSTEVSASCNCSSNASSAWTSTLDQKELIKTHSVLVVQCYKPTITPDSVAINPP